MKRNIFFIVIAALLLVPWPVAYAFDSVNADSTLSIQPADTANAPQMAAYGNAVGKVTPGDLFQVDTTGAIADTKFNMLITNIDELFPNYRFLNLKIGIYVQAAGGDSWEALTASDGEKLPDIYITMFGGKVDFTLPGGAKYKITIQQGCFYRYNVTTGTENAAPRFYLTAT